MTGKRRSAAEKQQAVMLSADAPATEAARQLGVNRSTVLRWRNATDSGTLERYARAKRQMAAEVVLNGLRSAVERGMEGFHSVPVQTAKDLQAYWTGLGIADDHFGGRTSTSSGRFGDDPPVDGEVVETAERITRRYRTRTTRG